MFFYGTKLNVKTKTLSLEFLYGRIMNAPFSNYQLTIRTPIVSVPELERKMYKLILIEVLYYTSHVSVDTLS